MTQEVLTPAIEENAPGMALQHASEVTSLVQMAIEQKVPVELLERLVALKERVEERNARSAFVAALAAFRDECPPIIKNRENTQFQRVNRDGAARNVRYAPLDEIDRIARPVAAKHGLVWTWNTEVDDKLMHITCRLVHVDGHFQDTKVSMPYESKAGSSPQQKYGSTQTYGMRYSLIAALGITTVDEDTDGAPITEVQKVSESQAAILSDLLDEYGRNKERFLKWCQSGNPAVEKLSDIPADWFDRCVAEIKREA